MAKSTKAASKATKAASKARKTSKASKAGSKSMTKATSARTTAKASKASKASKARKASKTTKAVKATTSSNTTGKATKAAKSAKSTKAAKGKRLSPDANAQLGRVDDLVIEVQERLEHLRSRYAELDDIEPDVGAGEDEGGASFDAGLVERDQIRSMIADEELILQRLGDAAGRVRAGTWRTCRVCGNDIGDARLEALPGTDLCVSCKAAGH